MAEFGEASQGQAKLVNRRTSLQLLPQLRPGDREVCAERSDWAERRDQYLRYVFGSPLRYFDPSGLAAEMCQRPVAIPLMPGQHYFIRFNGDNGDTMSYDPNGVHPDRKPDNASCKPTKGDEDDDCVRREMMKCKAKDYHYLKNNCCHCVEKALKACKLYYPPKDYPNWPINPGPLPGEGGQ